MNNFIKNVIEEKFASKAQQRFFYAQAGKGGKKGKKWAKWAKEFSDDTNFKKLPEKVKDETKPKKEVDEIVDAKGNIRRGKKRGDFNKSGITQKRTTDYVVKTGGGSMGIHGVHGTHTSLRYWAEGEEITKEKLLEIAMEDALGFDETMGANKDKDEAEKIMTKKLGLSDDEAEERLEKMGYDDKLPDDQVRLVEKKSIEEFIESVLRKKTSTKDLVKNADEIKEVNDIVKKQLKSLKSTMESNNLSIEDVMEYLKNDE